MYLNKIIFVFNIPGEKKKVNTITFEYLHVKTAFDVAEKTLYVESLETNENVFFFFQKNF